jgi:hypothetical protein
MIVLVTVAVSLISLRLAPRIDLVVAMRHEVVARWGGVLVLTFGRFKAKT